MLHMNVWKHKGLQSTVEVIVLGRARSSVSGVNLSAFHLSQLFSTCRGSGNLLVQSESCVGILCEKVDQGRSFSASSTSPDSYQFHPDSIITTLSVPKLTASFSPFDRSKMTTFNSSAQLDVRHSNCPTLNARQMVEFPASIKLSSRIKGLRCCSRVTANMKDQHPYGNNMLYRSFWSNTVGKNSHSNPLPDHPGESEFHSSSASPTSDVANDFPSDASTAEDQADNSTVSSEKKKPGERKLKLSSGSCYLPHPDKEETGGEDAHFICVDKQAIGVADGVGGWAELGVDAGLYARELMTHSVAAIEQEPKGSVDPSRVLEKAYLCTKARGSSTACIIALTDEGIHAVNLGDSGFIVVRDGCTVFRSPVQQHDFNFTYQLECGQGSDLPSSAQVFNFSVAPGDVIVAGTDGLFDNLYNNEVTAVVLHAIRAGLGPQVTAQKIAALARQRAQDKNRQTPFSTAAQDAGYRYYGGKLDDITVVVSYVTTSDA